MQRREHRALAHPHFVRDVEARLGEPSDASAPVTSDGMSWTSVPPIATLSTCMPRQIASSGMPAAIAARASAISNASRPGSAGS